MRDNSELTADLKAAKNGDSGALERLYSTWKSKLKAIAFKYGRGMSEADVEEVKADALIAFCNAVMTFDPEKDASFGTYAETCIRNRVLSSVNSLKKKNLATLYTPEDEEVADAIAEEDDLLPDYINSVEAQRLAKKIRGLLSDYENSVFWLYVEKKKPDEIASAVGTTKKSVNNALCRIRAKLRAALSDKKGADS